MGEIHLTAYESGNTVSSVFDNAAYSKGKTERKGPKMMAVYCDELNKRVMLPLDAVSEMTGEQGRLTVHYRCLCGQRGQLLSGRDRQGGGMSGHVTV